jgi:predicted Na+-dependent transporter
MRPLSSLKHVLLENQIIIVLIAMVLGLVIPEPFRPLKAYSTQLLILVFFASSLRLSVDEIASYARDTKLMFWVNAFMLGILPLALYMPAVAMMRLFGLSWLEPWALALLIFGAVPTGMTIALIADFIGGVTSLALVVTATTSLLAPLTIPLIFKLTIGQFVPIPIVSMFWSLALTIVAPFTLAMFVKKSAPRFVKRRGELFRGISVLAFGLLIAGIVADTGGAALLTWNVRDLVVLCIAIGWMGALTWGLYHLLKWRTASERLTVALCMIYMNNTLALFIANKFFPTSGAVPKLLLLLLAANILLFPIKWEAKKLFLIR